MIRTILFLVLLTQVAFGQAVVRGAAGNVVTYTTANMSLFVDPTGSDTNACTSTGTAACLTIPGALAKIPKNIRHSVLVSVAAGNYGGFYVSGFHWDEANLNPTAGITIQGTLANSTTLATGTATGTATSGTTGTGTTFGTLTDSGATWTVNDLRGRFLKRLAGTGALPTFTWVISSNTATTITVVGNQTSVSGTSTYAIQDSTSVLTGTVPEIGADGSTVFSNSKIVVTGNIGNASSAPRITVKNLRLSMTAAGLGISVRDPCGLQMSTLQAIETTGSSSILDCAGSGARCIFGSCYFKSNGFVAGTGSALLSDASLTVMDGSYTLVDSAHEGINTQGALALRTSEVRNSNHPIRIYPPGYFAVAQFLQNRINGTNTAGNPCISFSYHESLSGTGSSTITSVDVSNCVTGIRIVGGTVVVDGIAGSATATGILAEGGGRAFVLPVGFTMTAPTEIAIDNTAASSTFVAVGTGCLAGSGTGSRVCSQ